NIDGEAVNPDVQVGKVSIGTKWRESSLAVGVDVGLDNEFGTDDDALIAGGNEIIARLASLTVKGSAFGTVSSGDHFGIVAEEIAAFKSGGAKLPLTLGASNDLLGFS